MLEAKYDWQMVPKQDPQLVQTISEQCNLPAVLANLLISRGYKTVDEVQLFLKPQVQQVQTPDKLHDMDKAVDRIKQAITAGEKITIYGDYDADGITSTSVLYETLETMGAQVDYYIPNRFTDGYGPNKDAYQKIIENGTKLIVTVDNGVTGKDEVAFAKEQGVDVVITDHHSLPDELPQASAIVHPQYPGAEYPYGDLSGVGVAFKVAWALLEEFPSELLDLVAIGEIADLVEMDKENHVLVSLGIQQLQQDTRIGLHELLKVAGVDPNNLTSQDVGFKIAPRLNALGRIADANQGVKLLTTVDDNEATQLAKNIEDCNNQRQALVQQIIKEVMQRAQSPDNQKRKTLLIVGQGWHQGVLGIVASKVVEETGKPTIVASVNKGELVAKGSGRSVDGYDLFAALDDHRDLLAAFGGHVMACGMSFMITQVPKVAKVLEKAADDQHFNLGEKQTVEVAGQLNSNELSEDFYQALQKLAPFGPKNEEPVFEIVQPTIIKAQQIGSDQQHFKFSIASGNQTIDILAFNQGKLVNSVVPGAQVNLIGTLSLNVWRGQRSVQIIMRDLEVSGTSVIDQRAQQLTPQMFSAQASYVVFNDQLRENISGHVKGEVVNGNQAKVTLQSHTLVVVDTPQNIDQLAQILEDNSDLDQVKLYLFSTEKVHQGSLPTRQNFVQLYKALQQLGSLDLQKFANQLAQKLNVSGNQLIFMIKVFLELRFVTIKNGLLKIVPDAHAGQLDQTQTYQKMKRRLQVEQTLLKSSTKELSAWVNQFLRSH